MAARRRHRGQNGAVTPGRRALHGVRDSPRQHRGRSAARAVCAPSTTEGRTAPACPVWSAPTFTARSRTPTCAPNCSACRRPSVVSKGEHYARLAEWFEQPWARPVTVLVWSDAAMKWEVLLDRPAFVVRRTRTFSGRRAHRSRPRDEHVESRTAARCDHVRYLLNHQSCEGAGTRTASSHHGDRPRRVSPRASVARRRLPPEQTVMMGTAANMNYAAVAHRDRSGR